MAECVTGKIFFTSHSPIPKSWPGTSVSQCVPRDGSPKVERLPRPSWCRQAWHLLCAWLAGPGLVSGQASGPHLSQGQ